MNETCRQTGNHTCVLVCGNFGNRVGTINGQSIKTQVLTDALIKELGSEHVIALDTSFIFRKPLSFLRRARTGFNQCTHVIVLPARMAIHFVVRLFLHWRKGRDTDIRYVVIGGFLPKILAANRRLRNICAQLDGIYVETRAMAEAISALGLKNVRILPNFRSFERTAIASDLRTSGLLKLVFCARVFKEKGIEEAIAAVERVNQDLGVAAASLDVYGPINDSYKTRFIRLVKASTMTTYRGVVPAANVHAVLRKYDLMLLPTYCSHEGFPGTIVDAYIAGLPVVASDWQHNRELIEPGRTGTLCRPRSVEDLVKVLRQYIEAPQLVDTMRPHCVDKAQEYHVDRALRELLRDIKFPSSPVVQIARSALRVHEGQSSDRIASGADIETMSD